MLRACFALLCSIALSAAFQPDTILRVSRQVIASDCTPRVSTVFNGTSPGPPLRFKAGQHVWIRVYNDLPDANTTLHVHGISQYGSPFSDGTPLASQWPIAPGDFFDYEFSLANDSRGTYFYHTHDQMTAYGSFIIDDQFDHPYAYDAEETIILGDYYHKNASTIETGLLNTTFSWLGEPQTLLVNGQGIGPTCNASTIPPGTSCSTSCQLAPIVVKPDTTYRLRFIAAQILSYNSLAIEAHNFSLIEADADYTKPLNLSHLEIAAGQRYSVLLRSQAEIDSDGHHGRYWLNLETRWRPMRTYGAAILVYSNDTSANISTAGITRPSTLNQTVTLPNEIYSNATSGWVIDSIEPLYEQEVPASADQTIYISSYQGPTSPDAVDSRWFVGETSPMDEQVPNYGGFFDKEPGTPAPYLVQLYKGAQPNYTLAAMNAGYDNQTGVWPIKKDIVLDIVISNEASIGGQTAEAHPWHLHGRHFWYMGSSYGAYNATDFASHQVAKPYRRDTSVVYPSPGPSYLGVKIGNKTAAGYSVFRVVTSDPGVWLFHCHIIPHANMGMNSLLAFGADSLPSLPASYLDSYLTFGTDPDDNSTSSTPKSYWTALLEA